MSLASVRVETGDEDERPAPSRPGSVSQVTGMLPPMPLKVGKLPPDRRRDDGGARRRWSRSARGSIAVSEVSKYLAPAGDGAVLGELHAADRRSSRWR